ncbi:MAG: hypothetical protein AB1480_09080 [Nitrospirota bacterium]
MAKRGEGRFFHNDVLLMNSLVTQKCVLAKEPAVYINPNNADIVQKFI